MELWLAHNWYWILTLIVAHGIAFYRLGKVEKDLDEHRDKANFAPHPACPVHGQKFDDLIAAIVEVKASVLVLDTRIYDFMRSNGYKDKK